MSCFSGSESKQQSQSYTSDQLAGLKKALDTYLPQLGKGQQSYTGDRVADMTGLQNDVINNASNFSTLFGTPQTASTPLFDETGKALSGILAGTTGAQKLTGDQVNTYFDNSIKNPTIKTMNEDLLPAVDENYAGGNFFSTARNKSKNKVVTDVADTLAQQKSNLEWNVLQNNNAIDADNANRALSGTTQAMNYGQMPAQSIMNNLQIASNQVAGMKDLFNIGSAEQTQQQAEIAASMEKFLEQNQITNPDDIAIILSLLGMNYSSSSGSSSGAGLGYVGASSFMSKLGSNMASA